MKKLLLLAAGLIAGPVASLSAQSIDEIATYITILRTPVGALAPVMTNTLLNRLQNGGSLAVRYGNIGSGDFNATTRTLAVTGILPAGLGSNFSITGGVSKADCPGCDASLMLGVGGDLRLTGMTMGTSSTSPLFTVSLAGELGYGRVDPANFFSGYVGLPIALVQRGTGMQFVPFITPAFAIARASGSAGSESGTGLMLGGGLGIYNLLTNVTVNAGAQHSFMNGARNVVGINVTIGGK